MEQASPAIAFHAAAKSYGPTTALHPVTLAIPSGQFVALVGGSGSGKTTLLKLVNRLIAPTSGSIQLAGLDVATLDPPTLRRGIGYVFQGIGLFPHLSVAENIAVVPRLLDWSAGRIAERVGDLLPLVELPADFAARRPAQLSGGQRQRVGVARALAAEPRLLLMDEPLGALDPVTRDALGQRLRDLHDRLALTTVMVTHDMSEALLLADRIVVLAAGRVVADAKPAELLGGHEDPAVAALVDTPRRAAERIAALSALPEAGRAEA